MDGKALTCLLKCVGMRDFGGPTADATFDVMKRALLEYIPSEEEVKSMLLIVCADWASVNFGRHNGALTQLKEWVGYPLLLMHCLTHRLELAIKDTFEQDKSFLDLKGELEYLYRLCKN